MPRKSTKLTPEQALKMALEKLPKAAIAPFPVQKPKEETDELETLEQRIRRIFDFTRTKHDKQNMLFFVMYDIESNKVRRQVVKYLEKCGCTRVQKSIFLADMTAEKCNRIKEVLTDIQAAYENNDSIFVLPVSTDLLRSMRIIGKEVAIDVIMHTKNTLFF